MRKHLVKRSSQQQPDFYLVPDPARKRPKKNILRCLSKYLCRPLVYNIFCKNLGAPENSTDFRVKHFMEKRPGNLSVRKVKLLKYLFILLVQIYSVVGNQTFYFDHTVIAVLGFVIKQHLAMSV